MDNMGKVLLWYPFVRKEDRLAKLVLNYYGECQGAQKRLPEVGKFDMKIVIYSICSVRACKAIPYEDYIILSAMAAKTF